MSDFNKLKQISTRELEAIIARAISEATGENFRASISAVGYDELVSGATLQLKLSVPLNLAGFE